MARRIITALEITEDYLKLAQAEQTATNTILTDLALKKISGKKENDIGRELFALIRENKIKVQNLLVTIPRHLLTVRSLRFPSTDKEELTSMVGLQATKQIPYAAEDIITDFKIVEIEPSGFSKVFLAIVHKDVVSKYIKILEEAGVNPQQFIISSEALFAWFSQFETKVKNVPDPIVIVNVDSLSSDLIILCNNQLALSRSIRFNAQEQDQTTLNNFLGELKYSFATYQKEKLGPDVSKIILTGASNYFLSWPEKFKTELNLEVEIPEEPDKYMEKKEELVFPAGGKNRSVSLVNLFGLLLIEPELSLNLLPPQVRRQQERQANRKVSLFTLILAIFVAGAIFSLVLLKMFQKETFLNSLEFELKKISPQVQEAQQMTKRLEFIEERLNNQGTSIDVLYELYKLIPNDISLSIFNLEENGTVTLQGTAIAMSNVFNLVNTLEKSPFFQNVEVKYTSKRRVKDKEITDFQITASVSPLSQKVVKK